MTDFTTFSSELEACARIVVAHAAANSERDAWMALRKSGYTSFFIGAAIEQIMERAREIAGVTTERVH